MIPLLLPRSKLPASQFRGGPRARLFWCASSPSPASFCCACPSHTNFWERERVSLQNRPLVSVPILPNASASYKVDTHHSPPLYQNIVAAFFDASDAVACHDLTVVSSHHVGALGDFIIVVGQRRWWFVDHTDAVASRVNHPQRHFINTTSRKSSLNLRSFARDCRARYCARQLRSE